MSSCDKLTTRKVVRFQKWRGGNGQVWWDLLIIQLEVVQPKVEPILGFTFFVLGQGSSFKQQAASHKQLDKIKFIVYRIIKE